MSSDAAPADSAADGRLGTAEVAAAIAAAGLAGSLGITTVPGRTGTSAEAASALGTTASRVGKSVVFKIKPKGGVGEVTPVCVVIRPHNKDYPPTRWP